MSYAYEELKPTLFTESGFERFIGIRDNFTSLLKRAGAVRMQEAISVATGDMWQMMACVDRMVEMGELVELTQSHAAGQHRVFVAGPKL